MNGVPNEELPSEVLPGSDVIGYGYDVFGRYADPYSCSFQLFDFPDTYRSRRVGDVEYPINTLFTYLTYERSSFESIAENAVEEYQKRLNMQTELGFDVAGFGVSISEGKG